MIYGAIKGMVDSLGDPYTTFFDPEEADEFDQELAGRYEGVGMEIAIKEGKIVVVSPLEGTPAQKAGIKPKDRILEVDGESIEGLSI